MTDQSSHKAAGPAKGKRRSGGETRDALLQLLKREGPQDAGLLAARLGVSAMAVRQHLYELEKEGLVSATEEKGSIGRPTKLWGLEEKANSLFPDGHSDFTYDLIRSIEETFGEDGMAALLRNRSERQIAAYAEGMGKGSLKIRLQRLAEMRSTEGYMAAVEEDEGGAFLFLENHCPVCEAAKACSGLCAEELRVFRESLGPGIKVERTDHIMMGARRCAYLVHR